MSGDVGIGMLNVTRTAVNGTCVVIVVQLVQKARDAPTKFCHIVTLLPVIKLLMWFKFASIQFQVLSQPSDRFVFLKQE